jgi:phosphatidylcholine synthase
MTSPRIWLRRISAIASAIPKDGAEASKEGIMTDFPADSSTRRAATGPEQARAWAVHAYTAMGLVLAALAAVLVVRGDAESLRLALLVLALAMAVDATDGTLARAARVREVLPGFDGRRLDDIIDFHTYTSIPLLLIWRAELLPPALAPLLLLPLLASAYGFSQEQAKTDDGFFIGFPSYWNVLAFYLFFLRPPPSVTAVLLVVLALLTFVPTRYLYPTMRGRLNRATVILGVPWTLLCLAILLNLFADPRPWLLASLYFPVWYALGSAWVTLRRR